MQTSRYTRRRRTQAAKQGSISNAIGTESAGLPDFWVQLTKTGKNIPKLQQNIPNVHKIYEMAVK
jgi:hypothetical protein